MVTPSKNSRSYDYVRKNTQRDKNTEKKDLIEELVTAMLRMWNFCHQKTRDSRLASRRCVLARSTKTDQ